MGQRYEFAEFVLDPREGLLLRSNEPLKATPRLLALLEVLVDRPGRLVEKQELLDRVWEGTSVGEANLTVQVSKLRRLLGETGDRVFIETVPTRGYRFLVPVRVAGPGSPAVERADPPMTEEALAPPFFLSPAASPPVDTRALVRRPSRWRRLLRWQTLGGAAAIAVVLAAVAVAVGGRRLSGEREMPAPAAATATGGPNGALRLAANAAGDSDPAVSPDGRTVAFASTRDGVPAIYLLALDRPDEPPVRVPTRDPASAPAWSPDGARLAFVCQRSGQADICLVGRDGSGERVVAGQPQDELDPAWSPDGRRLAYSQADGRTWHIRVVDVDGTNARRVGPDGWSAQTPAWSPDGRRLAVSRAGSGGHHIWLVPLDGGPPAPLGDGGEHAYDPAWSPDGTRLAYATAGGLMVVDVETKTATSVASTTRQDRRPSWSKDGRSLVVESGRDGNAEIYQVPVR